MVIFFPYTLFAVLFFLLSIHGAYIILHRTGVAGLIVVAYPIVCLGYVALRK